ncbi:glutathione S-transferase family protein [Lichenihabitans sp. Uapishka_5]|uniref:glutathione S-transferase family protein n=1 Tax=Lichenihabitans sp. Uapishka_5 TaxID=3037302 RepID=UPI0029E81E5B|nr:glutathione S-transferase family protein [Lichenihabitans sp. Uapishka_5]MDX7952840.1 glutathione S-transferase family protein [Lichenihabitans sp. Uapishka_5]
MPDLILHQYDLSPFCEKLRLAFGVKDLAWRAVEVPVWPPRPDTVPLTAGFRRAPVLQVGADIYCDTLLILRELDRRHPEPTLYPDDQVGLASVLSWWADTTTFLPAATLTTSIIGDGVPAEFIEDRIRFMKHDFSKAASLRDLPLNRQRTAAQMGFLADMLKDGRPFLLGHSLSAADLSAYHTLWFARQNGGAEAEALLPFRPLLAWMDRVAAVGHGRRAAMAADEALRIAREAEPEPVRGVAADDPSGLKGGEWVEVRTDDANDPIRGQLVAADPTELVIRHKNDSVGTVHVHFPRFGYSAVAEPA